MALARAGFAALVTPDLRRVYMETGEEEPLQYPAWTNVAEMDWNPVKDQQVTGLSTMPAKPEGRQYSLDEPLLGNSISYEASPFGLAVEIPWELWRDELYGVMRDMARELSRSSRFRQEVDAHSPINNAFSSSFTGFDGVALCAVSGHDAQFGQSFGNRPSPDIGLSIAGVQSMVLRFENMINPRGLPMMLAPSMILINPFNKFVAREVLGSSGKPYTAQNEINALIQEDLSWMVDRYLTSQTAWFALSAKGKHDVQFLWRDHPTFDSFDDPRTKTAVFTVYQRHTQGFGSWRGVDGSNS